MLFFDLLMSNNKASTGSQKNPEDNLIRYGALEDDIGGSIRSAERRLSQVRSNHDPPH